ncbi:tRNA (guanine(46)-N(7))-methyltransferase TrmB [Alteromonas halophila]|uniref:tRNA (guanine(46)-N(7))-methyltransferase n=1 Tax=Alteromonas halophila TaxID=516698 RepID=A0A918JJD5_9ALTE|nr:methyltransferase domain-containing protein [Alteromonas halophila]GGW83070.1 hypothetical protein GCM10007391_15400 [Alteromonas halophila]
MSTGNSRTISTNQQGPHDKLDALALRYQQTDNQRPVSAHTQQAFDDIAAWATSGDLPVILDSCCGVGESTARLAALYPDCRVIGIDKSEARLNKHSEYAAELDNYRIIRADVNDFWRLVVAAGWPVKKHYLLYPNPYPKASQIQKRWHGSPAMKALMSTCESIEVRSNWLVYLLEFAQAAQHYGRVSDIQEITASQAFTPFERKYQASGQSCWQLVCRSEEAD